MPRSRHGFLVTANQRFTMLANPSIVPSLSLDLLAIGFVLAIAWATGRLLCGSRLLGPEPLARLSMSLVTGLLVFTGLGTTVIYGRVGLHTIIPAVLIAAFVILRQRLPSTEETHQVEPADQRRSWIALVLVTLAIALGQHWLGRQIDSEGNLTLPHSDMGFFAVLAAELPTTPVSNSWVATMGPNAIDAGATQDLWYHWGPIWLTMLIHKLTGLPCLEALTEVTGGVLKIILVLSIATIVRVMRRVSVGTSCLIGIAALLLTSWPMFIWGVIAKLAPDGYGAIRHDDLYFRFSYHFEIAQALLIMVLWLRRSHTLALVFIACATISSPHFVGGIGPALGLLMIYGWIRKDPSIARPMTAAVVTILSTGAALHLILGPTLASGIGSEGLFADWTAKTLLPISLNLLRHLVCSLLFAGLLIPGWRSMITHCDETIRPHARVLALLAVSGTLAGMIAYDVFSHPEKFHFTQFPHVALAIPIAACGYGLLIASTRGWAAKSAILFLTLGSIFGVHDVLKHPFQSLTTGIPITDANALRNHLHGAPFGYFSSTDRQWHLPRFCSLAAALDSRCIRINMLPRADLEHDCSRFYADYLPLDYVPINEGETLIPWSLRLARSLNIEFLIHRKKDPLPEDIIAQSDLIYEAGETRLYKLKRPAPSPLISQSAP